jgi:2,4-dienoyl-CoA reductase-like NADH-dependent reductase (Old Yellow Enzyme family)
LPNLFSEIALGRVVLPNRIAVAPMCQYSADDGSATDWHLQHLMQLAFSGAGLVTVEATAVERPGRITHSCLGLYSDSNERALNRVMDAARAVATPGSKFAIQLAHAGRKASQRVPWEGGGSLSEEQEPWPTIGPSALSHGPGWATARALTLAEIERIRDSFVQAAIRSARIGFEVIELHFAHGYLLHQFLSPLSNQREDRYGGDAEGRERLAVEILTAIRAALPETVAVGARISGSDWAEGGLDETDAARLAEKLGYEGAAFVCVTTGGLVSHQKINAGPGFQVPHASHVKRMAHVPTRAVGMIVDPLVANALVESGEADMVALARAFLDNPRWVWHAAEKLGVSVARPPQYARAAPEVWSGAKLARPPAA